MTKLIRDASAHLALERLMVLVGAAATSGQTIAGK
jgi:hypothetical protein